MMDSMRNAAKSWVAKLLIGLLAVSFGVWGIADVFNGLSRGAWLPSEMSRSRAQDFNQSFSQYLQNYTRQTGQRSLRKMPANLALTARCLIISSSLRRSTISHWP